MRDWHSDAVLKQDLFGRVERGRFISDQPPRDWVRRDASCARWWARPIAWWLRRREAAGLIAADGIAIVPRLLRVERGTLLRSWVPGTPMHVAQPRGRDYFRRARKLLAALHHRRIAHNDLAKEANWLVTPDGRPAVIDFQLSWVARRRGLLFRLAAREDLRHLLKHKSRYCGDALTQRERTILARPSWPARGWRSTVKRVYWFVTRRLLRWADREGASERQFPLS